MPTDCIITSLKWPSSHLNIIHLTDVDWESSLCSAGGTAVGETAMSLVPQSSNSMSNLLDGVKPSEIKCEIMLHEHEWHLEKIFLVWAVGTVAVS